MRKMVVKPVCMSVSACIVGDIIPVIVHGVCSPFDETLGYLTFLCMYFSRLFVACWALENWL